VNSACHIKTGRAATPAANPEPLEPPMTRTFAATAAASARAKTLRDAGVTFKRDGRVRLWDVYRQSWLVCDRADIPAEVLASYGHDVRRYLRA